MFRNLFLWILNNVFHIQTQATQKEITDNDIYAVEYERIDEINFSSIFSNKLANYVINDSNLNLEGETERTKTLDNVLQSIWKKGKKFTSMAFGYGGVVLIPYVKGGKIYYNIIPQNRMTIDSMDGEVITGATILAEKKEVQTSIGKPKVFLRWSNYKVEKGNLTITQKFTDENGYDVGVPDFWKNILDKLTITGVDRVLFGYIKSPINNRKANDKYGVPITYGCESTIQEIKDTMKQLYREYKLKETFVGADATMFNGKDALPLNGIFKKVDAGDDTFFEVFDPQFRSYTDRLEELYRRLEHEIGTSAGIVSQPTTQNATATEIRRAMYDTFTIVDDMRSNIEKAIDDFTYSANVLANAYNINSNSEYNVSYDWSYDLLEDTQEAFTQLMTANAKGIISDAEVRQFIKPDETIEDAQKAIDEIKANEPSVENIIGNKEEEE